ncbi:MAG TPA: rhodanese-like domain-containing protein [Thermoanaerobaculia bacterium]|nr:rhodanese-like domain-containing protein [Thermoanaerobaculia bacterium]
MNRRFWLEAATLVIAAVICALVSNALAGRERKLALKGEYPNALKVPQESVAPAPQPAIATPSVAPPTSAAVPTVTSGGEAAAAPLKPPPAATKTTTTATDNRQPTTPLPVPAPAPKPDLSKFTPHPDKAYTELAYDDVAALHAAGALFLDARRTSVYEQGHIAGARSFSVWESDIDDKVNKLFTERSSETDQAKPIVVYCSGGECEDSHMLAQKLWGIQFNNVYVYKDGFPDWQKHGAAIHTGSAP